MGQLVGSQHHSSMVFKPQALGFGLVRLIVSEDVLVVGSLRMRAISLMYDVVQVALFDLIGLVIV